MIKQRHDVEVIDFPLVLFSLTLSPKYDLKLLFDVPFFTTIMAFNPEVALFNLLEDAQTSAEVVQIIEDFIANS